MPVLCLTNRPKPTQSALVLRRHNETTVPLPDVKEVHLQQSLFLDIILLHPTRFATSPYLHPVALHRSKPLKPVTPEKVLYRVPFLLFSGICKQRRMDKQQKA